MGPAQIQNFREISLKGDLSNDITQSQPPSFLTGHYL
jgi:hypothetical protein